jgi:hypothetical protein
MDIPKSKYPALHIGGFYDCLVTKPCKMTKLASPPPPPPQMDKPKIKENKFAIAEYCNISAWNASGVSHKYHKYQKLQQRN